MRTVATWVTMVIVSATCLYVVGKMPSEARDPALEDRIRGLERRLDQQATRLMVQEQLIAQGVHCR